MKIASLAATLLLLAPVSALAAEITVPPGFKATVVFDGAGPARHIAVRRNGDVYISTRRAGNAAPGAPAGIVALRDTDGDGRYDLVRRFSTVDGTGLRFRGDELYASSSSTLYRFRFAGNDLTPGEPETIVSGMPTNGFPSRGIAFDGRGGVYLGVGSGGNMCNQPGTTPPRAADPCPDLATRAGVWRYSATKANQRHPADGERYATGLRDMQGLDWDPATGALYGAMQGRNGLDRGGARTFSADDNSFGVADELHRISRGANLGWPYSHFDGRTMQRLKAPEYGGAPGVTVAEDAGFARPAAVLPAHSSPLDIVFYRGRQFPAAYRDGAFVALQGGSEGDRPQNGYQVLFVPKGFGAAQVFADGFAGAVRQPAGSEHRPSGVAVGPDGALFVVDAKTGKVWKITYRR